MHIPTHQIHNVLDAYVRRLKTLHDAGEPADESPENRINSWSADAKRRWIIEKISADIIHRIVRSGAHSRPDTSPPPPVPKNSGAEEILYHVLMPDGTKISKTIQIQNPDFLIRQIEDIARNSRD
jgi:hypothetical protein